MVKGRGTRLAQRSPEVVSNGQAAKSQGGSAGSADTGLRGAEEQGRLEIDGRRVGTGGGGSSGGRIERGCAVRFARFRRLQPPGGESGGEAGADPDDGPDRPGRPALAGRRRAESQRISHPLRRELDARIGVRSAAE